MSTHAVYIVQCKDNTLYTGYTNNLTQRIKTHNEGGGAKYTRGRVPVTLIYSEVFEKKGDAMRREIEIKKLSRAEKLTLTQT